MSNIKKAFFEKIFKLWEESDNSSADIDSLFKYYTGENYKNPADSFFLQEKRTPLNIIGQIVDAKHSAVLDAQFSATVMPEIYTFSDMSAVKDMKDVANVLDKGLKQVLRRNGEDDIKERVLRWGFIKRGAIQTLWDTSDNPDGDIKLSAVDPRTLRYNKGAQSVDELTMIAYSIELDATVAKKDYARLPDGSFDVELCKKIDQATGNKIEAKPNESKAIAPYSVDSGAGLAYVKESQSQGNGKPVNIVVMFLFDGSLEAPKENQTAEESELSQEMKMLYPNGRMLMFVPDKEKQIILKDEPAPESFKNLGNIDLLLLNKFAGLEVKSEVESLTAIQERINGTIRKLRAAVGGNINSILFDERHRGIVDDNAFVNLPVNFIEGLGDFQPPVLKNGGIEQAMNLKELIEGYKQDAYETARINRAWISGQNQDNVKSGEHADALNESAMTAIRSIQRNFKDFWVSVCEKIVALMLENYTTQRLVEIGSGFTVKEYAMFDTEVVNGQEQRSIKFINEAGRIARIIKLDPAWKFKVDVSSGTEIPRSRRATARLIDEVMASPIMQSGDIEMISLYLEAKDFPNWRAVVEMMKKKQEEKAKQPMNFEALAQNTQVCDAVGKFIAQIEGFSAAQGEILKLIGLSPNTDTITTAPAQSVTAKSNAKDIAIIAPQQISEDPQQAHFGHAQATDIEVVSHASKQNNKPEEAFK